ncbi:malonyl-[acyl-carrier protein] O-methyltransferase BioC [Legionella taurinensis]|uniref:Malonyl-[acyl-carrier protein] O-methyltransferase n=1 Tax=Legionella taurinensis TaxID=70611 RepID=A0A3A5L5G3_9GAMM|nr:malonyl-ACP O-methyltransferase BioC [Legionella taurinensis]MDX1837460.1 malonyl-ACP O-methyltransferase BioC [Legionella taurinensis]PUT40805.1 malonyl-[acyl-carrier protein] O-methyltransferase BioC [Legionella taurinensis]PUT44226.1 malonyl-[acyl-carrier protein] O-methyltransferase BioC [Legionella taurinensis]PUT47528.1 malonyl-[acyl-carrier protein] O-methyltransferase BioC [Legionella taurinensis]PUT48667.1 malonyl-[acyl-carrier protein] O-methyltransferase BioC [Legionella taurinen
MNLKNEISNSFNTHAGEYDRAAKIQHEIGNRLFERLDYLKINPRYVLDLGCGTGIFSRLLKKRYADAHIIGIDLAEKMLNEARKKQGWRRKWALVNADMTALPFPDGLFDLVFANQAIHWVSPLKDVMREINRVMSPDASLLFSTLGPDTFKELKQAWAGVDSHAHTNTFADMHDVGDCLLAEHFLNPVVDMEWVTVHYSSLKALVDSLKAQGVRNINQARNKGLTGKGARQAFEAAYQQLCTDQGKYPLTYEVVYGHAFKGQAQPTGQSGEVFIPITSIQRKVR